MPSCPELQCRRNVGTQTQCHWLHKRTCLCAPPCLPVSPLGRPPPLLPDQLMLLDQFMPPGQPTLPGQVRSPRALVLWIGDWTTERLEWLPPEVLPRFTPEQSELLKGGKVRREGVEGRRGWKARLPVEAAAGVPGTGGWLFPAGWRAVRWQPGCLPAPGTWQRHRLGCAGTPTCPAGPSQLSLAPRGYAPAHKNGRYSSS